MQSVSSRIWTRVAVSISYDVNHYTTDTSKIWWATFNGHHVTTILSRYGSINVSVETGITVFYNDLSYPIRKILLHNIQINGGDMHANISKDGNIKFCSYN